MNDRMKNFYMNMAKQCANMSRAVRLKVGAVIVKNHNIVSFSWNGTPAGWDNNCEHKIYMQPCEADSLTDEEINIKWPFAEQISKTSDSLMPWRRYALKTKPEVLHAEMNALMKLAKCSESGYGAAIFITHAPCMDCAKGIFQAGIIEVYYHLPYRCNDGIEFLKKCQVTVEQIQ
jgi:dCMP deaminase